MRWRLEYFQPIVAGSLGWSLWVLKSATSPTSFDSTWMRLTFGLSVLCRKTSGPFFSLIRKSMLLPTAS